MQLLQPYLTGFFFIFLMMSVLWLISIPIRNVSIVDIFWGLGFVAVGWLYFYTGQGNITRKVWLMAMVTVWGLRLSGYIAWRNIGKGEDFRYKKFRTEFGEHRYWWYSYFSVFMLQGIFMWLISATLIGAQHYKNPFGILDIIAIILWIVGFLFEAVGDYQLARFKHKPENKDRVMDQGLWKYTRHPNYFGEAMLWVAYALMSISAGGYLMALGAMLMIALIIKVSGVTLLDKALKNRKAGYEEYMRRTSAFFPWLPKK